MSDEGVLPTTKSADELVDLGTEFYMQKKPDVARMYYDAALIKDPDNGRALQNLSSALMQGYLLDSALTAARRAMRFSPDKLGALMNLTAVLHAKGEFETCLKGSRELLAQMTSTDARYSATLWNCALTLTNLDRCKEAHGFYDRALISCTSEEQRSMITSDRALNLLKLGKVREGCKAYEVRWANRLYKSKVWSLDVPQWNGENLAGKRIIFHHEQGFGDGIMLVRLVPEFLKLGCELAISAPAPLVDLFTHHLPWQGIPVFDWNEDEEKLRQFGANFHVPMLTALGLLGFEPKDIPSTPYLHADRDEANLGADGFRVGICWASGYHSFALNIRRRYVPLELFFPLSEIPGVRLVSLQKDAPAKDILNLGAEGYIHDPMPRCADFSDTARIIAGLDLVIAVDSAIAHLAGALGIPTLMLGPYVRCWRWWGGESGWPWYENFAIFPQTERGNWQEPMRRVNGVVENRVYLISDDKTTVDCRPRFPFSGENFRGFPGPAVHPVLTADSPFADSPSDRVKDSLQGPM